MPRVRFNTRFASPDGNFEPGQEADLPHHQASALVKSGSAVPLGGAARQPASSPQEDAATRSAATKPPKNAARGGKGDDEN